MEYLPDNKESSKVTIRTLVCAMALLFSVVSSANGDELPVYRFDVMSEATSINSYLQVISVSQPGNSLDAIKEISSQWQPASRQEVRVHPDSVLWAKVSLKNTSGQDASLLLLPDGGKPMDGNGFVNAYIERSEGPIEKYKSGRFLPRREKSVHYGFANQFLIKMAKGESLAVYLEIYQISKVYSELDVKVMDADIMQQNLEGKKVRQALFHGMLWIIIFFSALLYIGSRDHSYLYYVLYLSFVSIYFLYQTGFFQELFFVNRPRLHLVVWILSGNLLVISYIQFVRSVIDTRKLIPRYDQMGVWWMRLIWGFIVVELLILVTTLNEAMINTLANVMFTISVLFLLLTSIRFIRTKNMLARIMIFGTLCLVFAGAVGQIAEAVSSLSDFLFIIQVAMIAEVLTFSLGLGYRQDLNKNMQLKAQEQLNLELRQMDKLKDQFLANTSHELRTPLNGIIGITESLLDGLESFTPEFIRDNLRMVITSSRRLSSTVNDILDFAKIKNYQMRVEKKSVDLHSLVDVVLKINQPLIRGKSITMHNQIDPELEAAFADESRIQQVLHNLVGNAIKFTEEGSITVDAFKKDGMIELTVSDTGIGIPVAKLEVIFQEFQQVQDASTREFAGTGLGLSISKRLVELHDGQMWVESEIGVGSTFHLTLPISKSKKVVKSSDSKVVSRTITYPEQIVEPEVINQEVINPNAHRILIVDDEVINHQLLTNHLRNQHYRVVSAMNGQEALDLIDKDEPFDLVLLDIMMPKMSGYEVCQQIRKRFLVSELPVIMVTAKNQVTDLVQGLTFGANDYISKPFTKDELLARIKTQLDLLKINSATGKFVPRKFIETLGHESILDVRLGDNVEREVTVFFSDVRSYTTLAESMSPDENFKFVSSYSRRMGPIVKRHHGLVNQYLGDGIMSIFLKTGEDALKAAIEMQGSLIQYNKSKTDSGQLPLRVGMGMHTGKLIMGIIGDEHRMDTATISDTVNTASRMEGLTKYFGVNIILSEATLQQLENPGDYGIRFLGKIKVKGKHEMVKVYECFDGDSAEARQFKQQTSSWYHTGIQSYFERDFDTAVKSFAEIIHINPDDKVTSLYLFISSVHRTAGLADHWTGIEIMSEK